MVDPGLPQVIEYAEGYLENKSERDASYQAGLKFLREGPPRPRGVFGILARLFGE